MHVFPPWSLYICFMGCLGNGGRLKLEDSCVWASNFCSLVDIVNFTVLVEILAQIPALLLTSCVHYSRDLMSLMCSSSMSMVYTRGRSRYIFHVKQNYYWNRVSTQGVSAIIVTILSMILIIITQMVCCFKICVA